MRIKALALTLLLITSFNAYAGVTDGDVTAFRFSVQPSIVVFTDDSEEDPDDILAPLGAAGLSTRCQVYAGDAYVNGLACSGTDGDPVSSYTCEASTNFVTPTPWCLFSENPRTGDKAWAVKYVDGEIPTNDGASIVRCEGTDIFDSVNGCRAPQPPPVISINGGYFQLDTTEGNAPVATHCSQVEHDGRMVVDDVNDVLYICTTSGWTTFSSDNALSALIARMDALEADNVTLNADNAILMADVDALQIALAANTDADALAHHSKYTEIDNVTLNADVATLQTNLAANTDADTLAHHSRYTDAEVVSATGDHSPDFSTVLAGVSRITDPNTSQDTLRFTNMNVQVVSGGGFTNSTPNGTGNLIIGYNEGRQTGLVDIRTGSHVLVIGERNNYSGFGGMVVGWSNTTSGEHTSVSGGNSNTASGKYSSVSGGTNNTASTFFATVHGGAQNTASGNTATVNGGRLNTASGVWTTISGGESKTASSTSCTVGDDGVDC